MRTTFAVLLPAVLLLGSPAASGAGYKCTDATGKVSFQQTPCPTTALASRIDTGAEWRLLSSESYGAWGTDEIVGYNEIYFDPEHIVTVDGYPRVAFKTVNRVVRPGSANQPDKNFFFYVDCPTGNFSNYKGQKEQRPGKPDSTWGAHHWTMGSRENARKVLDAACHAGRKP